MESLQNLAMGFSVAMAPQNLMFAFLGSAMGTLIGVLPGVGPTAGVAILIPLTFQLDATGAIIMLCAIFAGAQYGGTITSVLLNVPGEAASVVTCLDGYRMARNGRAGVALSIAAVGSFIGGTVAIFGLVGAALPLSRLSLGFGPAESFALMVFGISLVTSLAGKSMVKGLLMGVFGLILAMVGMDPVRGSPRFTFGQMELMDGVGFIPVIMGLLGLGEILTNAEASLAPVFVQKVGSFALSREVMRDSAGPIARGTVIGFAAGFIPGVTSAASSFMSYVVEKRLSKHPEKFGTGVIEGVAGPETANNAHIVAALIPLFSLGLPTTPGVAVLMGAFMMNGLIPGPFLFEDHPAFVWGVIASMYTANMMLIVLNLPLIRVWVRILEIPYSVLFGLIIAFMVIGSYSVNNAVFDISLMVLFGVVGYLLKKFDFPVAPLVLTLILGPMMEKSLRRTLDFSQGDYSIFLTRPAAGILLLLAALFLFLPLFQAVRRSRVARKWEGADMQ